MTVALLTFMLEMICSGMGRPGRKSLVWTQQVKEGEGEEEEEEEEEGDSNSGQSSVSTQPASL